MTPDEIIKGFDSQQSARYNVQMMWQMLERYVVPYKGKFFEDQYSEWQIDWHQPQLYDSTAIVANSILAASMQTALTNPSIKWANMLFSNNAMNTLDQAMEWLQECEDRMFGAINTSNFNLEASQFYIDLTGFGTAAMAEEINPSDPKEDFLHCDTIPIDELFFEEDYRGRPLKLYRQYLWTPLQIVSKFGDKVPQDIKDKAESVNHGNRKIKIIFCIYKRKGNVSDVSKKMAPKKRPYGYKYIVMSSRDELGEEGGYYEMPVFMTRWNKTSNSQWGHCPGMICMADILTLNTLAEATLEACGKVVDPATIVTEKGLLSDLDLGRGGLTVVRSMDEISTFESGARFDVGELKIQNLQKSIDRAFHIDQLELKDSPSMTATEANIRYELMQRLLGPTLGRLQNDFLDPFIKRTFFAMYREGLFPPMPDVLLDADTETLIEYTGPLPMSQKGHIVNSVREWMGDIVALKEINPEIDDWVDYDAMAKGTAIMKGVPARFVSSEEQVAEKRKERDEKIKQAEAAAMAQAQGDAAQSVGAGQAAMNGGANGEVPVQ